MISFFCSGCGKALQAKDNLAGKKVKCPKCGHAVLVAAVKNREDGTVALAGGLKENTDPEASDLDTDSPGHPEPTDYLDKEEDIQGLLQPPRQADEMGRLGSYRILKILGKGGMGVVFQAEDPQLKRQVALKVMLPGWAKKTSARKRFLLEAQATAALEHLHIVTIFQVGEDRGIPYIAMQYLRGESLEGRLKKQGLLPLEETLRIGRQIAEGLNAAHERKLLHRDIKPANIWLEAGKDQVKILDFGLTRACEADEHLTQTGTVMGTPAYMAPEQAEALEVDQRCDLFSLGCILYRMSTGELPFQGASTVSILKAVALHKPRPPVEMNRKLPPGLSDLILQLLEKDPERRPDSAQQVADALERLEKKLGHAGFQAPLPADAVRKGAPVPSPKVLSARLVEEEPTELDEGALPSRSKASSKSYDPDPPSISKKEKTPGKKTPAFVLLMVGGLSVILIGLVVFLVIVLRGRNTPEVVAEKKPVVPPPLVPAKEKENDRLVKELAGHSVGVWHASFSPLGKFVVSAGKDKTVRLWSIDTGREVRTYTGHTAEVTCARYSPDGEFLLSTSSDGTVRLWDAHNTREMRVYKGHEKGVWSVALAPNGEWLVSGGNDNTMRMWDFHTGEQMRQFVGHTGPIRSVAVSPSGQMLLSCSEDKTVRLWRTEDGSEIQKLEGHQDIVYDAAFSPDGSRILSASADKTLRLWNVTSGKEIKQLIGHTTEVNSVAFAPSGLQAFSGEDNGTAILWDLITAKPFQTFQGHKKIVFRVAMAPDGRYGLTSSFDQTIKVWNMSGLTSFIPLKQNISPGWVRRSTGHQGNVFGVAISPDGKKCLTANADRTAILWDLNLGVQLKTLSGHTNEVNAVAFVGAKPQALTGSDDGSVRLWNLTTGQEILSFSDHGGAVWSVAVSGDGKFALSSDKNGAVMLWDLEDQKRLHVFKEHVGDAFGVAISSNGERGLSAGKDGVLRLLDLKNRAELHQFRGHQGSVRCVAISPDGGKAVSGGEDKTVRLWDLEERKPLAVGAGHDGVVYGVAYSPKKNLVLSGSGDNTLRLWDETTGKEARRYAGHTKLIWGVAVSADGLMALTGSFDRAWISWRLPK